MFRLKWLGWTKLVLVVMIERRSQSKKKQIRKKPTKLHAVIWTVAVILVFALRGAGGGSEEGNDGHDMVKNDGNQRKPPKEILDEIIRKHLAEMPGKIDRARRAIQDAVSRHAFKSLSQGWSILVASWKDIVSDWIINNRTLADFGGANNLFNYGFLASYGAGFGLPLVLGQPKKPLPCDSKAFVTLVEKFDLESDFYGDLTANLRIDQFDLVARLHLRCTLPDVGDKPDPVEAAEVEWGLDALIKALRLRVELEDKDENGDDKE